MVLALVLSGLPRSGFGAEVPVDTPPSGIADLKAMEKQIQMVVAKVRPCVVTVSGGSGVVVSKEGLVLTVAHVTERAGRRVTVTFPDGRRVRGTTLGNDHGVDAGMVRLEGKGPWPVADMGKSADLKPGQWCMTLGYPVSFERGKPAALRVGRVLWNRPREIFAE